MIFKWKFKTSVMYGVQPCSDWQNISEGGHSTVKTTKSTDSQWFYIETLSAEINMRYSAMKDRPLKFGEGEDFVKNIFPQYLSECFPLSNLI